MDGCQAPRRIVFVAPNWLGDVVMASPVLSALRRAEAEDGCPWRLVWVVRRQWAPLFADDPRIDSLIQIERDGPYAGLPGAVRLGSLLGGVNPDAILLGPPSFRMGLAAMLARARVRSGYATDGRGPLLNLSLQPAPRGAVHYTREMLAIVSRLARHWGLSDPVRGEGDLQRPPGFRADDYLPGTSGWPVPAQAGPPLWAISPGTTFGPAKNWPATHFAAFLTEAVRTRGRRVVLLGDAGSRPIVEDLVSHTGLDVRGAIEGDPGLIDLTGRTGLRDLVGILRGAEAFVGNDSGLMHMAGALGTPTVGIFGSSNPDWTAPAGCHADFVQVEGFSCSPCYRPVCNQAAFCLESIHPRDVLARLDRVLAGSNESGSGS